MVYAFDEYELDDGLCELRRNGEPYHLEPQVFDVLAFLVRHRDRLVTRDELLDEIWGHRFVTSSALGSRIKDARRALGDDGRAQRVIKTVRGRGYRFLPEVSVRGQESAAEPAVEPGPPGEAPSTDDDVPSGIDERQRAGGWAPSPRGPISILPAAGSSPRTTIPPEVELERLHEAMERARSGARQIVLVSGPSGAGKTVLLDEFLSGLAAEADSRATGRDHPLVVWGQCLDQSGPGEAYLPLLDALDRLCRADDEGAVVDRLARQAPSWAVQMPFLLTPRQQEELARRAAGATRERMLRELVSFVEALAAEVPLVLLLEDVHWSDPSTLDFVLWLARRPEPARLMLVATFRGDEKSEDLRELLAKVRRTPGVLQLELSPWGPSEVEGFLGARFLHHDFPGELANLVVDRTTGNPLFVTSLIDTWIERGVLRERRGRWEATVPIGEMAADLPDTLRRFLEVRLNRLAGKARCVLEAASVVGSTFSCAAVAAALGTSEEEVEATCRELVRETGFLAAAGDDAWPDGTVTARFSFAHDLYRDVLYGATPLARRSGLHDRAGSRIERGFGDLAGERRAGELAVHFGRGRDDVRAVRYQVLAARLAVDRRAPSEAVRHLRDALEIVRRRRDLPHRTRTELEIQELLAPALLESRGWSDPGVGEAYEAARALATELGDADSLGRALYGLAYLHEFRGDFSLAQAAVRERLELRGTSDQDRMRLEAYDLLSCSLVNSGDFAGALENADRAVALADHSPGVKLTDLGHHPAVSSHYWGGFAQWFLGRPDRGLELVRRSREIAHRLGHHFSLAFAETRLARIHQFRREPEAVAEHARAALELARRHGFPYQRALAGTLLGWSESVRSTGQGDASPEAGLEAIRTGLQAQLEIGAVMDRPYGLGLLADALLVADRPGEVRSVVDDALSLLRRGTGSYFWEAELHRLRAVASMRLGDPGRADESLETALRKAREQGALALELRAVMTMVRFAREGAGSSGGAALEQLAATYERFTEGFDTADLRESAALLTAAGAG